MKLAQLNYERELGMTPLSRATLKLNTTRAAFDLPSAMIDQVVEIGESRAAKRAERGETVEPDADRNEAIPDDGGEDDE